MKNSLREALDRRRPQICARWEALLRLEKEPSPLGSPGALVFLFDQTLDEVLGMTPKVAATGVPARPVCRCDCNPLRHYFAALEQALLEALVWAQSEDVALSAEEKVSSVGELCRRLRVVARREIVLLDGLCRNASAEPPET
jgi:hypothetical protein